MDPPGPEMGQKSVSEEALLHIKYPKTGSKIGRFPIFSPLTPFFHINLASFAPPGGGRKDSFHDFDTFWEKTPKSAFLALQMTF